MNQPPAVRAFALAPGADLTHLVRSLPGIVRPGPWKASTRVLLDTFDGRLARRQLTLWWEDRRRLLLEAPSGDVLAAAHDRLPPVRAGDVAGGSLGDALKAALADRAATERVRLRLRRAEWRLENGDGKTVVRLVLDQPAFDGHPLPSRVTVRPVTGYGRQAERVIGALSSIATPARSAAVEALEAAGVDPFGWSNEVDVELTAEMEAGKAAVLIWRRLAEIVEVNLPGTLADTDPEFLHDLRVAIRRTRAVLKELRAVLDPDVARSAGSDMRWIQIATGRCRDLDVLLAGWDDLTAPVPPAMYGDLGALRRVLDSDRAAALVAMRRALRSGRFRAAWAGWRETISSDGLRGPAAAEAVGVLAGRRIWSVYRAMRAEGAAISDASPAEALHDLRKRGKELRYLLELFGRMWPPEQVKPLVGALKALQDVLGQFQDDEIQIAELRRLGPRLAAERGGTDSLLALGFVVEGLAAGQRQARQDFASQFAAFARPGQARAVKETFRP